MKNVDIQSLNRCFDILETLISAGRPLGLTELAKLVGIHPSTAYGLLSTMTSRGYTQKTGTTYRLGPGCFRLGQAFSKTWNIGEIAEEDLRSLRDWAGERVSLGILSNDEIVYLKVFESPQLLRLKPNVENSRLLHCTAMGKVLLSTLPDTKLRELLSKMDLPRFTEKTICDVDALLSHLEKVRELGYSINDEEEVEGLIGVAVPLRLGAGSIPAGVAMAIPLIRWTEERKSDVVRQMQEAAKRIERKATLSDYGSTTRG